MVPIRQDVDNGFAEQQIDLAFVAESLDARGRVQDITGIGEPGNGDGTHASVLQRTCRRATDRIPHLASGGGAVRLALFPGRTSLPLGTLDQLHVIVPVVRP